MTEVLVGGGTDAHVHLVSAESDEVPWRNGLVVLPGATAAFVLDADAALLGRGREPLASLSTVRVPRGHAPTQDVPDAPSGDVGAQAQQVLVVVRRAGADEVTVELGLPGALARQPGRGFVDPVDVAGPARLLVATSLMGRADVKVSRLRVPFVD